MSKRRTYSPEFKARVVLEATSGRKTIQEIAADHAVHPVQVSQWKKQLLEGRRMFLAKSMAAIPALEALPALQDGLEYGPHSGLR